MDATSFEELLRIQNNMASLLAQEAETDNKIKVLSIIDDLTTRSRKKIQVESVLIEAQNQGLSEGETLRTIDQLISDRLIIQPEPGYVQKA